MKLRFLGWGTLIVLLAIVGVIKSREPKIFRKAESGLSVGGVSVSNMTANSKRHCSMGFVLCVLLFISR